MIKNPNYVPNIFPGDTKNSENSKNNVDGWSFAVKEWLHFLNLEYFNCLLIWKKL